MAVFIAGIQETKLGRREKEKKRLETGEPLF
jgi:hypothetical protein